MIAPIDLGRRPDDLVNLVWRHSLRLWHERAAANQARLAELLASTAIAGLVREFCNRKTEAGRKKILLRLCEILDPCDEFGVARLRGASRAMWAAVALEAGGARVEYVGIGDGRIIRGAWNLKVRDHALERFCQRGGIDISEAMLAAHQRVSLGHLYQFEHGSDVLVAADRGAFRGTVAPGGLDDRGVVTAWSWVHADRLTDGQRARLAQPPDSGNEAGRYPSSPRAPQAAAPAL